ncbi:MAG: glycosyltransferase family 2 protein [Terricaulis sp.]
MDTGPDALIAVVSFNTRTHWPRLKAALEAQTWQRFRLIVVDNASTADQRLTSADMPAFGELVQLEDNIGFAAANNRAFEGDAAEFFVCLNPDAFPAPDWLERLIAAARAAPHAGAIGSLQIAADDATLLDGAGDAFWAGGLAYRALHRRSRPAHLEAGETFSACAAAALYRADVFREAGGFDESFFCYCEDVDLGFRMRLMGRPTIQADDAVVAHVGGGSAGARSRFALFHGTRNRLWTFVKSMPWPLLIVLGPVHVAMTLFVMAWSLIRGTSGPTWDGVFQGLRGLPRVFRQRRTIQAKRRASSLEIARALTWSPFAVIARTAIRRTSKPG